MAEGRVLHIPRLRSSGWAGRASSVLRCTRESIGAARGSVQPPELMRRLAEIGYDAAVPPKPLFRDAAHDVLGIYPAQLASTTSPIELGRAEIVALGDHDGALTVVRIPGHGDYYGRLRHDLYFAGWPKKLSGRLFFAEQFYVLCVSAGVSADVLAEELHFACAQAAR